MYPQQWLAKNIVYLELSSNYLCRRSGYIQNFDVNTWQDQVKLPAMTSTSSTAPSPLELSSIFKT
jgi:hypothetical protein